MSQSPLPAEGSRRRLPKSKTGCRTCKKRKVKCDEGHPACRNCVKHGVDCDFIIATPSSSSALPSPSIQLCSCNHEPSSGFTINDLELLHHYTTSACLTFSTEPMVRNFWRVNVPQMGFTTPYILKGMLSLSALHLAKFRPDRKDFYVAQAFLHHNAAVNMVSPIITKITVENCVPVFLFSTITNYFAFAKPKESDDFLLSSHSAPPDWLMLFRGVRALMEAEHAVIHHSSVAAMFETGIAMHQYWLSHTFENEAFRELEANIRLNLRDEPEKLDVLMQAMATLKRSYATVYESPQTIAQTDENKVRGIFIWLFKLSNPYIMLVGEGNNEALCILAYFCVLMRRLDFLWWMEGWGLHLIERIYSKLNDNYRLWIRWPIEEIGWVPDYMSPSY
ncbi:putative C6 transcription factor [Truncatella angustata]|uniref:C6 transcription factor n=1 Tax=Truncatella angustata TaxID=152316 RepID=A0A9P8UJU6_9PEZI|nr:putative C6 transcription factor [Truncatella angustata]KAH6653315.1 putative C6 transcription factor [Truncatella angustata]